MKIKKIFHHLLLTISLAFGAIITGTSINAQAQQINTNTNNIQSNNQDVNINNSQINNTKDSLVNVPNENRATTNNYHQIPENNSKEDYYNSGANDIGTFSKYNSNENNNYKLNSNTINQQTNNIYNKILLNITKKNKTESNVSQDNKPKHFVEYTNNNLHELKIPTMRLSSLSKYSNKNSLRTNDTMHHHQNWFRDGLNKKNLEARSWVSWHESNHRWRVLSYGHVCVGYFQLSPSYLGYRHGHVNLNKKHQVKTADAYVRNRYGNWINAKRFWEIHHWY